MNEYRVFNGYTVVTMVEKRDHAAALAAKDAEILHAVDTLADAMCQQREKHAAVLATKDAELDKANAEIERLRKDLELTRGAMDAQDRREREAGEKCSVSWLEVGCDWPDWVADEVLSLRANVERLRKDNSGLHEIQDLQREHIVERDRRIAELEKAAKQREGYDELARLRAQLAESRKLSDEQYQFALQTVKDNEALKAALEAECAQGNTTRDLLDRTATALHGGKWPGLNSWHDLPERAAKMRAALVSFSNHHKKGLLKHVGMSCFKAAHDALEGK